MASRYLANQPHPAYIEPKDRASQQVSRSCPDLNCFPVEIVHHALMERLHNCGTINRSTVPFHEVFKGKTVRQSRSQMIQTIAAFGLILCAVCGCSSGRLNSRNSNPYEVTVEFHPEWGKTNQTIKITTRPGVPFAVQTQDESGNHYQVSGTLRLMSPTNVRLEQWKLNTPVESESCPSFEFQLGKGWNMGSIPFGTGHSITITKKQQPFLTSN